MVEPNNTGEYSVNMAVHDEAAIGNLGWARYNYADEVGCAVLVPVFPRPKSYGYMYTHALTRETLENKAGSLVRIDLQLIAMVEDLKERCKSQSINLEAKFLMNGYSASGVFVNHFAAIHPERVQAVAAGGINCMPILPAANWEGERLIYSVGIADLGEITGAAFNLAEYKKVPQFLYMGADDQNDTLPHSMCFTEEERQIIIKVLGEDMHGRWPKAQAIYTAQGCDKVTFKTYPGVGHSDAATNNQITADIVAFLKANTQ